MDRYFYSVESDYDGNKVIHLSSNVYLNDGDTTETNYRCAEWTFFYIPIEKLKKLIRNDCFYDYVNEKIDYLCDITKVSTIELCAHYFDGKPGAYLHIEDVNEETPYGDYWFE